MGDPAAADESLIPPAIGLDDPNWILGRGTLDYAAEARLINDNLLDFSHLTFVHANSFQAGSAPAQRRPELEVLERGVRFTRWNRNSAGGVGRRTGAPVDRYMSYDFLIPGIRLMWNGSFPAGTADACGSGEPDREQALESTFTCQPVTPMTEKTSRYFFSWGPHRNGGDEQRRDVLMEIAARAFAEDKAMIEAQQRVIDGTAHPAVMPTSHDRGLTIFNRMVEKLAREEASTPPEG